MQSTLLKAFWGSLNKYEEWKGVLRPKSLKLLGWTAFPKVSYTVVVPRGFDGPHTYTYAYQLPKSSGSETKFPKFESAEIIC